MDKTYSFYYAVLVILCAPIALFSCSILTAAAVTAVQYFILPQIASYYITSGDKDKGSGSSENERNSSGEDEGNGSGSGEDERNSSREDEGNGSGSGEDEGNGNEGFTPKSFSNDLENQGYTAQDFIDAM